MSQSLEPLWIGALADYGTAILALPGSKLWVAASAAGEVQLIDPETSQGMALLAATERSISVLGRSQDGKRLAAAGQLGQVVLWESAAGLEGWRRLQTLESGGWIDRLSWHPRIQTLAFGLDREVEIWQEETIARLAFEDSSVLGLAWHPGGDFLAVAGMGGVKIWRSADWAAEPQLIKLPTVTTHIDWSPDGRFLVMGNQDATLVVVDWANVAAGANPWVMRGLAGKVRHLVWCGDDRFAMSCLNHVALWRFKAETDLWEAQLLQGHGESVRALAYGEGVLASGAERVCLWDRAGELVGGREIAAVGLAWGDGKLGIVQADGGVGIWQRG
jgi:WD40 repeat protein